MQNEFEILGQKIVVSNEQERELATFALQVVNEKIAEIKAQKPLIGGQQLAVLTLLHVAGDMVKDRQAMDEYRRELDARCSALMTEVSQMIDNQQKVV